MTDWRALSFWHDTVGDDLTPRPHLDASTSADVAIVGGGLTGLWTAYYLLKQSPGLRVVVLEKRIAGFGASGRNGGWVSALFPASAAKLARQHGRNAAIEMRHAMISTVDEVGRVVETEGIEADFAKGGTVSFARSEVQLDAAVTEVEDAMAFGVDPLELWGADRVSGASDALGAAFDPSCARVHPAKLVRGLAHVVETLGAVIYESTEVLSWVPGRVTTARGIVSADRIVIATEGYGATIAQTRRRILPLYSLMIATEPLSDAAWDDIGIQHGQTFADYRHLLVYGQRTADNRFAFGGRGARYHWGSSIRDSYDRDAKVFAHLERALVDLFPRAAAATVTHRWGGPLGVPRDWHAGVLFDDRTGLGSAGGYVGDGLSTTNLAGRTLCDLLLGQSSALTALPWVGHRSPDWEPEPLRFVGSNLGMLAMSAADIEERATGRASLAARVMGPLVGH
jgi:glycine/D-amino acid oxidase-like deaminating enzyme